MEPQHRKELAVLVGLGALLFVLVGASTMVPDAAPQAGVAAVGASAATGTAHAAGPALFPSVSLPTASHLDDAIARLGDKLPEVAAWYGMTPLDLRTMLKNDGTLWVDHQGRLFYKEAGTVTSADTTGGSGGATAFGAAYPLDQTFLLHSDPGARRVIYLNFTGATLSGVAWNSYNGGNDIVAPAWDIDGDRTTFGDTERQIIQHVWERVAEDYAPFDVDVTTEPPAPDKLARTSSGDEYYGTTALVSPISSYFGNYGGIAYLGVYNATNNLYYEPALIFSDKLANNEKYLADSIAHEVGHNVGLSHDGKTDGTEYYQGQGVWAPIMGNAYYRTITQWSKGEYANANNTQDDLAIMVAHGLDYRPDQCGGTASAACSLRYSGDTVTGSGIIERTADADMWKFTTDAGAISIAVAADALAPDLNMRTSIRDAAGREVVTAPDTTTTATLSATVPAGTYYLVVQGVGSGDPLTTGYSDYASLGQYSITGTVHYSGALPPTAVAGATPTSGNAPLAVQFSSDGSSDPDGTIVSYHWDFGDGSASDEANPQKTYEVAGTYQATLTVTDGSGLSDSAAVSVTVASTPPTAVLSASPRTGDVPLTVSFDGSGSYDLGGNVVTYEWDFGDGQLGTGAQLAHTYAGPGTFVAQLTVTDNDGMHGSAAVTITVNDPNTVVAPSGLSGDAQGSTVTLSWMDNATNESAYEVYRAVRVHKTTPAYVLVATLSANSTAYTETVADGTYLYRVAAVNLTTGTAAYSDTVSVRVASTKTSGGGSGGGGGNGKGKR